MRKAILSFTFAALAVTNATGQSTAAGSSAGSSSGSAPAGGTANTPTTRPTTIPSTPTTNPQQNQNNIQRTIFISGKVMVDDGSPLPPNIVIQRVCGANPRSVAYTDSRGHFSFQWGAQSSFMADASEAGFSGTSLGGSNSGGFGNSQSAGGSNPLASDPYANQMSGCEIRAQAAGFRSDVVSLVSRNPMDNPDIGLIVLHRMGNVEGTSVSATSLAAPKDAKKAYDKGVQFLQKSKTDDASKEFEKAVLAYPKYADAWVYLGKVRLLQKAPEPAREAMLRAMEADPKLVAPYIELGLLAAQEGKWSEAGTYLDKGLKLDPVDFPQAWYIDAAANFNLKKFDAAEKSAREAQKLDSRHNNPRTDYLLGLILAEKHDYPGAADQFRAYLKNAPNAADFVAVKDQLGKIEKFLEQTKEASK